MTVEHVTSRVYVLYVENNKRIAYELSGSNVSTFSYYMRMRNYFVGPFILSSEARISMWVAHEDIHSLLANGFHNDILRGKLGRLIILGGPATRASNVEPSLE